MTSGYQNSAGTDLDNLFLVDNSNAGPIGFQVSTGQDLGNRYNNGSTLGYAVGFQNSAGTDLGFLRGNYQNAGVKSYYANLGSGSGGSMNSWTTEDPSGEGSVSIRHYEYDWRGWLSVGMDTYGTNKTYQLAIAALCGNNSHGNAGTMYLIDNNSSVHPVFPPGTSFSFGPLNKFSESSWLWIYNGPTDDHPGRNFSLRVVATAKYDTSSEISIGLAVYQKVFNSYDPGWRRSEFWFN